ncbi:LrgB family protein [Peptoniphilus mikwangii]|uniref:LrgB family protein n=1 Tax=Peptoniphilus mikwangii TaxID=1354300 RepID=UPI000415F880|nr:LrgB family protein [Peptoniphilus mikwangii]
MFSSPYFGLILSASTYGFGMYLKKKIKSPLINPLLISIALCIIFLKTFNISYEDYEVGGRYISFMIAPATVALVVPLYHNLDKLLNNLVPIIMGILSGSVVALVSIIILCKLFGLSEFITISLLPQSITTAIGIPLCEEYGGSIAVTAMSIVIRGIIGAVSAPIILKIFGIKDKVAVGISIGTASHAVGTSKAVELGEIEGAMSGLSIAIAGIITVFLIPFMVKFI